MTYHPTPPERTRICELSHSLFQAAFDDWDMMMGVNAKVEHCMARTLPYQSESFARIAKDGVVVETKVNGAQDSPIYFVFPSRFVGPAVFQAMMIPSHDNVAFRKDDEGHMGAAKELMNLFCGSATRALQESGYAELRVSQSVDDIGIRFEAAEIHHAGGQGSLLCVQLEVKFQDQNHRSWCLLPEDLSRSLLAA